MPLKKFSRGAKEAMEAYRWPGNVRALRHAIERAIILSGNEQLEPVDLQIDEVAVSGRPPRQEATELNLEQLEKTTVEAALRKHAFNISAASKELGLTRASLYRRMEKHGL
jgi:DNA-binding NtrC family response regulator